MRVALSPGTTISAPLGRRQVPVTSAVRKKNWGLCEKERERKRDKKKYKKKSK